MVHAGATIPGIGISPASELCRSIPTGQIANEILQQFPRALSVLTMAPETKRLQGRSPWLVFCWNTFSVLHHEDIKCCLTGCHLEAQLLSDQREGGGSGRIDGTRSGG